MSDAHHPGAKGCTTDPAELDPHWIANGMPQVVWTCQPDGSCDFLNRRWVEYTGAPEGEALGLGWLDFVHPDDRDRALAVWRNAVAEGRVYEIEVRIRRHDGAFRWFHALARPLRDEAGHVVRWVGSSTDVDDRMRADDERERLLAQAQRHADEVAAILSAHADGLIIYGPNGEVRSMNPAAREMVGLGEVEIRDFRGVVEALRPVDDRGEPVDPGELPSRRAMRGERVQGVVFRLHTRRGPGWFSTSVAPLRASNGTIVGAVLSFQDVTHLHRLQEEREQITRALTHDARTRLNVIQTHGELLGRARVVEDDVRRRGGIIASSARQLADTINALVGGR